LALCACGSSGHSTGGGGEPKTLVAALGDSITAGNPAYDPSPQARAAAGFGDDPRSQFEYWAERADPTLKFRNCGAFGERTGQIAKRFEQCTKGAKTLIVQGGINDIAQSLRLPRFVRRRVVNRAARNLAEIVRRGKATGLDVAITDVLPWNNGYPLGAERSIRDLNRLIDGIGHSENVPVIPFYETLDDAAAPGRMKPQWTADGDHPSIEGYRRLGEAVARTLKG